MNGKRAPRAIVSLTVRRAARLPDNPGPRGWMRIGPGAAFACALGRGDLVRAKREGDGGTPAGASMRLLNGWFRPDRFARPRCLVPLAPLPRNLGWCDDPRVALYNRPAPLPMKAGHEEMWRSDGLYDIVFVMDWNIGPRRAGRGSAIFLHCAKDFPEDRGERFRLPHDAGTRRTTAARLRKLRPTLGCIALDPGDMLRLLPRLGRKTRIRVV